MSRIARDNDVGDPPAAPCPADAPDAPAGEDAAPGIAELLGMQLQVHHHENWPLGSSRFSTIAHLSTAQESFAGWGAGESAAVATRRAVMECVERYAQFGVHDPALAVKDTCAALTGRAIAPPRCGLYTQAQYLTPGFACQPFSARATLEWVEVSDAVTGEPHLLPVEFLYPRAQLDGREPLVVETSSGTATHRGATAATLAAVCEVIERDGLMLFWYRQPLTAAIPLPNIPSRKVREDLLGVQRMGYVLAVCRLVYDLDVPCFLVVALKGDTFAYGLGCHPEWRVALEHAVSEIGQSLLWLQEGRHRAEYLSLPDVRTPKDHYYLYNGGPLHHVFRQVLANVLYSASSPEWWQPEDSREDAVALQDVLRTLVARGYQVLVHDLTPERLRGLAVKVVRVLVPGLIPLHFGYGYQRLGCRRLWAPGQPGRLRTLLPHFVT